MGYGNKYQAMREQRPVIKERVMGKSYLYNYIYNKYH